MKKRVFLDGIHTAIININETNKTVVAEIKKTKLKNLYMRKVLMKMQ